MPAEGGLFPCSGCEKRQSVGRGLAVSGLHAAHTPTCPAGRSRPPPCTFTAGLTARVELTLL